MDPLWYQLNNISSDNSSTVPALEALAFWPFQIILIGLYSATAIISLTFNIITIIVLSRKNRFTTEMWRFLISLSMSDITMALFSIPFTYTGFMLGQWILPPILCPIVQFAQMCSVFVSVWTLTLIGLERYYAIVHTLEAEPWIRSHKTGAIAVIWLTGVAIASSQLLMSRAVPFKYDNKSYYDCREEWSDIGGKVYTVFIFSVTFVIPIVALISLYTRIAVHLLTNRMPGNPDRVRDEFRFNRNFKILRMLVTIVVLFLLCWLPIHIFSLLVWLYPDFLNVKLKVGYYVYVGTYFLCHWVSQFHSVLNPIVYCFMSENFRTELYGLAVNCWSRMAPSRQTIDGPVGARSKTSKRNNNTMEEDFV